jgi:hypothetical protein
LATSIDVGCVRTNNLGRDMAVSEPAAEQDNHVIAFQYAVFPGRDEEQEQK